MPAALRSAAEFEIVRGPNGVDRTRGDRTDVGDRADDVGLHGRVEVEPDLTPFGAMKMSVQLLPQGIAAPDIQYDFGQGSVPIGPAYVRHCRYRSFEAMG